MDSPFFALAFYTNFGVQTVQYIIGTKGLPLEVYTLYTHDTHYIHGDFE
jgi:hypothetical protein